MRRDLELRLQAAEAKQTLFRERCGCGWATTGYVPRVARQSPGQRSIWFAPACPSSSFLITDTMRRDLERRLRILEIPESGGIEVWFHQGDGTVCGPRGERLTREEAEALARTAGSIPIFFSETDARL
jgi:hypothetical protein